MPESERRLYMQSAIAWTDAQQPVPRNTPAACKAKERRILRAAPAARTCSPKSE